MGMERGEHRRIYILSAIDIRLFNLFQRKCTHGLRGLVLGVPLMHPYVLVSERQLAFLTLVVGSYREAGAVPNLLLAFSL